MQTLNVNTIEFEGVKAAINSYSDHPALVTSMNRQREEWTAEYPNATVRTERMSEEATRALVANGNKPHTVGSASKAPQGWGVAG